MAELEKTFKQNGGEWKEFRIGDLFISYNGDFDIQKTHLNDRGFYVVSSGEQNMGIIGKTDLEARIFPKNTITCDMFGNVYYRNFDYKMVTHARVFCLEFIAGNLNEKIALFIISAMKFLRFKFQYSNMASWRKIQDLTISLPVYNPARHCEDDRTKRSIEINKMDCHDSATAESRNDNKDKNYTIAFDFMEKYIQELEAYLLVARLKDTRLTEKEKEALRIFATLEDSAIRGGGGVESSPLLERENFANIKWWEFQLGELFEIFTGRDVIIGNMESGDIPLISHQNTNNGVAKYIKRLEHRCLFNYRNTVALADRGVFYATTHNQNFHIRTRVKALVFKEKNISRNIRLFFVVAINRLQIKFIEYSANATDKLSNERISLPVYQNNQIAFDFMEDFIKSIEKAHIDNIYRFWQNKLSAYKDVVAGSGG